MFDYYHSRIYKSGALVGLELEFGQIDDSHAEYRNARHGSRLMLPTHVIDTVIVFAPRLRDERTNVWVRVGLLAISRKGSRSITVSWVTDRNRISLQGASYSSATSSDVSTIIGRLHILRRLSLPTSYLEGIRRLITQPAVCLSSHVRRTLGSRLLMPPRGCWSGIL